MSPGAETDEFADCVCCTRVRAGGLDLVAWTDHGLPMVELAGELDIFAVREFGDTLATLQRQARRAGLVLVLTHLTFADSSGLGAMVAAMKRARDGGGSVVLVEAPEHFRKVLRITGLDRLLPVVDTLEQAWAHIDEAAA